MVEPELSDATAGALDDGSAPPVAELLEVGTVRVHPFKLKSLLYENGEVGAALVALETASDVDVAVLRLPTVEAGARSPKLE